MQNRIFLAFFFVLLFAGVCAAQVPVVLMPTPQPQYFNVASGGTLPLSFGCVFTYQQNTTNPLPTYTDYTGTVQNSNPVNLNAAGIPSSSGIWIQAGVGYSIAVYSAGGVNCATGQLQYTINGISGGQSFLTTSIVSSSSPTFVIQAQNQLFEITLTTNATAQPLTAAGIIAPAVVTFRITQDATGGRTFAWPANSVGGCTIGAAANQVSTQAFVWDGVNARAIGPCITGAGPTMGGDASSASSSDHTPTLCTAGMAPTGVTAVWAATGCTVYAQITTDLCNTGAAPEVCSTHLSSPLPAAQGGTASNNFAYSGTSHTVASESGSMPNGNLADWDGSGDITDAGIASAKTVTVPVSITHPTIQAGVRGTAGTTVSFNTAFAVAPICTVTQFTGSPAVGMVSTSTTGFTVDGSSTFEWICMEPTQ